MQTGKHDLGFGWSFALAEDGSAILSGPKVEKYLSAKQVARIGELLKGDAA